MAEDLSDAPAQHAGLPSVTFDLDHFDPKDRMTAIHDFFGPAVQVSLAGNLSDHVSARIEMWQLGNVLVLNGGSPEVALRRSPRQVARDGLDHWILRVLRSGVLISRTGDRVYRQERGDVVLDSMAEDFADHWTRSDWISFVFPREGHEQLEFVNRDRGLLRGPAVPLFAAFANSLVEQLKVAGPDDTGALSEVTSAMVRSCFVRSAVRDELSCSDLAHRQRETVRAAIRENLASPRLSPERLCELTGLSRSTLYRLFDGNGGICQYIKEKRLALVMQDLRNPATAHSRISDLAELRGFHNASAFGRSFRTRFGCTPGEVRQATLLGAYFFDPVEKRTGGFAQYLGQT
jgi:AraC-like DNA-binding protein